MIFFTLLKKHYKAFKKEWDSHREINKWAKNLPLVELSFRSKYDAWVQDIRHEAKVFYNPHKSAEIKEEIEKKRKAGQL